METKDARKIKTLTHRSSRVGETRVMGCGQAATVIRYGSYRDIDVQFEDGYISTKKQYLNFQRGAINNPNIVCTERIGEARMMDCGQAATIIRYGSATDIDVQFEDGNISTNKTYANFQNGKIGYPKERCREGEVRMMNCGLAATIIRYGNSMDIDVQFEDGTISANKTYGSFQNGNIGYPKERNRVGEKRIMSCGQTATITRYGSATDIDVQFEDGAVAENKFYSNFKNGRIGNPNEHAKAFKRKGR